MARFMQIVNWFNKLHKFLGLHEKVFHIILQTDSGNRGLPAEYICHLIILQHF